jgi:hypothetical protein
VSDDELALSYAQLHTDGELRTGNSKMRVELFADDHVRLTESYTWSDGRTGENVLESVEVAVIEPTT